MIGADEIQQTIDAIRASQGKLPPGATLSLEAWHRRQRIDLRDVAGFFTRRVTDVALDAHAHGITSAQAIAHGVALESFLFGVIAARQEIDHSSAKVMADGIAPYFTVPAVLLELA